MTLTTTPAVEFSLPALCDIINRSFKGYVGGDFTFIPPGLAHFLALGGVHLARSLVALQDGEPAGIAMLARLDGARGVDGRDRGESKSGSRALAAGANRR